MFILRFHFRVVKTLTCCLVRILLLQEVEVEQQARGGAHIAAQLDQLCVRISGGDWSQERFEGLKALEVERFIFIMANAPSYHDLTVFENGQE